MSAYDVFISYSGRDEPVVAPVARELRVRGLSVFFDRWSIAPGQSWPDRLEAALAGCSAVAAFVGPEGLGGWQKREIHAALDRQVADDGFPVVPVLLPGVVDPGLGFLRLQNWIDLRDDPADPERLDALARAVSGKAARTGTREEICPYRGLAAFREEDAPFFFGRRAFTERLIRRVGRSDFVSVIGASGSGKSSVVQAGLVPALRRGADGRVWDIVRMSPGAEPLEALARALDPPREDLPLVEARLRVARTSACLRDGSVGLGHLVAEALARQPGTDRLLLFVDQFEELATHAAAPADAERFIDALVSATSPGGPLTVVATLRSDYYGELVRRRDLVDRIRGGVENIGPLSREAPASRMSELEEIVRLPAEAIGLRFEEGLVPRILGDVGHEPGRLPLLEYLLLELWRKRSAGVLTHAAYERLGGVGGALASRAEEAFGMLSPEEREAARPLFLSLVRTGPGHEHVRLRAPMPDDPLRAAVARRFAGRDLRLVVAAGTSEGGETVELAHEALIRSWATLREWADAKRDALRARDRVRARAARWREAGMPDDLLLPAGLELEEGLRVTADDEVPAEDLRDYVRLSERHASRRRRRLTAVTAATVAVLAVLLAITLRQYDAATSATRAALLSAEEASSERDLAEASVARFFATEAGRLDVLEHGTLGLLLAVEAARLAHTSRTDGALRAALSANTWEPLAAHEGRVGGLAFLGDEGRLVSAGGDGAVWLWDLDDPGRPGRLLHRASGSVDHVAAEEGAVAAGTDGRVLLWRSTAPGAEPAVLPVEGRLRALAVGMQGTRVAIAGDTLRVVDVSAPAATPTVPPGVDGPVRAAAFSPDGEWFAAAGGGSRVFLWRTDALDRPPRVLESHQDEVYDLSFSRDPLRLASGGFEPRGGRVASVWNLDDPAAAPIAFTSRVAFDDIAYSVSSVSFAGNGDRVLLGGTGGQFIVWFPDDGTRSAEVARFLDRVTDIDMLGGGWIAVGGTGGLVRLHDIRHGGKEPRVLAGDGTFVFAVALDGSGRRLVAGDSAGAVRLHDVDRPATPHTALLTPGEGTSDETGAVALSPDGGIVAIGNASGRVRLVRPDGGEALPAPPDGAGAVRSLAFDASGARLAIADGSGLRIAAPGDGTALTLDTGGAEILALAFEAGGTLRAATGTGEVLSWSGTAEAKPTVRHRLDAEPASNAAFHPEGRWLALGHGNDRLSVFDLSRPGSPPVTLAVPVSGNARSVFGFPVAFSPDGRWLAFASDGRVWLWSVPEWDRPSVALSGDTAYGLAAIAFSGDSRWLATGGFDGAARVWAMPEVLVARACARAGRNLSLAEWRSYWGERAYARTCPDWPLPDDLMAAAADAFVATGDADDVLLRLRAVWGPEPEDPEQLDRQHRARLVRTLARQAVDLAWSGPAGGPRLENAAARLAAAFRLDPGFAPGRIGIGAGAWNTLCWNGALWGVAGSVLAACDAAVAKAGPDRMGYHLDSRGLARALSGDLAGALDDFAAFLAWADGQGINRPEIARRREWVATLEAGGDPFDAATIEALRHENL